MAAEPTKEAALSSEAREGAGESRGKGRAGGSEGPERDGETAVSGWGRGEERERVSDRETQRERGETPIRGTEIEKAEEEERETKGGRRGDQRLSWRDRDGEGRAPPAGELEWGEPEPEARTEVRLARAERELHRASPQRSGVQGEGSRGRGPKGQGPDPGKERWWRERGRDLAIPRRPPRRSSQRIREGRDEKTGSWGKERLHSDRSQPEGERGGGEGEAESRGALAEPEDV